MTKNIDRLIAYKTMRAVQQQAEAKQAANPQPWRKPSDFTESTYKCALALHETSSHSARARRRAAWFGRARP